MDKKHNKAFIIGICIAIFLGIIVANYAGGFVSSLLAGLVSILVPLTAALVVIFVCKHIMAFLESKILNRIFKNTKGIGIRVTSLILSLLFFIGIIVAVCYMFIPRTISVIGELISNSEVYEKQLIDEVTGILASIFGNSADDIVANITDMVTQWIKDTFNNFLPQLSQIGTSILGVAGNVFMGTLVAIFYLIDREGVNKYIGRMARVKMGEEKVQKAKYFMAKSDRILIDYLVAKVIECIVITVILGIIMTILGVEASFELAFIIGVLNAIPYVGYFIAIVPMALITLVYGSVSLLIQALIWVSIAYILITTFITPIIVGKKVKMNMIVMFISMIVGGCLFGMLGMMLGIPAGAVISEFVKEDLEHKEAKKKEEANSDNNDNNQEAPEAQVEQKAVLLASGNEVVSSDTKKAKRSKNKEEDALEIAEKEENVKEKSSKKGKKKAEKEEDKIVEEKQEENSKIDGKNKEKTKKSGNKIKQLFSKIKYSFSNISPENEKDE